MLLAVATAAGKDNNGDGVTYHTLILQQLTILKSPNQRHQSDDVDVLSLTGERKVGGASLLGVEPVKRRV